MVAENHQVEVPYLMETHLITKEIKDGMVFGDDNGWTVLEIAIEKSQFELGSELIDYSIDPIY